MAEIMVGNVLVILGNKEMDNKSLYITNDDMQVYPLNRLKFMVEKYGHFWFLTIKSKLISREQLRIKTWKPV